MVTMSQSAGEDPVQIHDDLSFVSKQDVAVGETHKYAYEIKGPENYVLAIDAGTLFAPAFYDTNGDQLDDSTSIIAQKADRQGNPLGNAIVFEDNFDVFDYSKFRSDPEYFRFTHKPVVLDEKEFLKVFLDLPSGHADFDASQSRLTIGDKSTRMNQPAFIRRKDQLSGGQQQALNQGSGGNSGGN